MADRRRQLDLTLEERAANQPTDEEIARATDPSQAGLGEPAGMPFREGDSMLGTIETIEQALEVTGGTGRNADPVMAGSNLTKESSQFATPDIAAHLLTQASFKDPRFDAAAAQARQQAVLGGREDIQLSPEAFVQPAPVVSDLESGFDINTRGEFRRGVEQFSENVPGAILGLRAGAAAVLGDDQRALELSESSKRYQEAAARVGPRVQSLADIDDFDDAFDWALGASGSVTPTVVAALGAAAPAAAAAPFVGLSAAVGGTLGAAIVTFALEGGGSMTELFDEESDLSLREKAFVGFTSGLVNSVVEAYPIVRLLKGVPGLTKKFPKGIEREVIKRLPRRMAEGVLKQGSVEGATEVVQEAVQQAALVFVSENREFMEPDMAQRMLDAFAYGFVGGGPFGGVFGAGKTDTQKRLEKRLDAHLTGEKDIVQQLREEAEGKDSLADVEDPPVPTAPTTLEGSFDEATETERAERFNSAVSALEEETGQPASPAAKKFVKATQDTTIKGEVKDLTAEQLSKVRSGTLSPGDTQFDAAKANVDEWMDLATSWSLTQTKRRGTTPGEGRPAAGPLGGRSPQARMASALESLSALGLRKLEPGLSTEQKKQLDRRAETIINHIKGDETLLDAIGAAAAEREQNQGGITAPLDEFIAAKLAEGIAIETLSESLGISVFSATEAVPPGERWTIKSRRGMTNPNVVEQRERLRLEMQELGINAVQDTAMKEALGNLSPAEIDALLPGEAEVQARAQERELETLAHIQGFTIEELPPDFPTPMLQDGRLRVTLRSGATAAKDKETSAERSVREFNASIGPRSNVMRRLEPFGDYLDGVLAKPVDQRTEEEFAVVGEATSLSSIMKIKQGEVDKTIALKTHLRQRYKLKKSNFNAYEVLLEETMNSDVDSGVPYLLTSSEIQDIFAKDKDVKLLPTSPFNSVRIDGRNINVMRLVSTTLKALRSRQPTFFGGVLTGVDGKLLPFRQRVVIALQHGIAELQMRGVINEWPEFNEQQVFAFEKLGPGKKDRAMTWRMLQNTMSANSYLRGVERGLKNFIMTNVESQLVAKTNIIRDRDGTFGKKAKADAQAWFDREKIDVKSVKLTKDKTRVVDFASTYADLIMKKSMIGIEAEYAAWLATKPNAPAPGSLQYEKGLLAWYKSSNKKKLESIEKAYRKQLAAADTAEAVDALTTKINRLVEQMGLGDETTISQAQEAKIEAMKKLSVTQNIGLALPTLTQQGIINLKAHTPKARLKTFLSLVKQLKTLQKQKDLLKTFFPKVKTVDPKLLKDKSIIYQEIAELLDFRVADFDLDPINIWHGSNQNADLSNLALRPFDWKGRSYQSVEHAYQTNKSGEFDAALYKNPRWKKAGTKIRGKNTDVLKSEGLMRELIFESFKQNEEAAQRLRDTFPNPLTHLQDKGVWRDLFPMLLMGVRNDLVNVPIPDEWILEHTAKNVVFDYLYNQVPEADRTRLEEVLGNIDLSENEKAAARARRDFGVRTKADVNKDPRERDYDPLYDVGEEAYNRVDDAILPPGEFEALTPQQRAARHVEVPTIQQPWTRFQEHERRIRQFIAHSGIDEMADNLPVNSGTVKDLWNRIIAPAARQKPEVVRKRFERDFARSRELIHRIQVSLAEADLYLNVMRKKPKDFVTKLDTWSALKANAANNAVNRKLISAREKLSTEDKLSGFREEEVYMIHPALLGTTRDTTMAKRVEQVRKKEPVTKMDEAKEALYGRYFRWMDADAEELFAPQMRWPEGQNIHNVMVPRSSTLSMGGATLELMLRVAEGFINTTSATMEKLVEFKTVKVNTIGDLKKVMESMLATSQLKQAQVLEAYAKEGRNDVNLDDLTILATNADPGNKADAWERLTKVDVEPDGGLAADAPFTTHVQHSDVLADVQAFIESITNSTYDPTVYADGVPGPDGQRWAGWYSQTTDTIRVAANLDTDWIMGVAAHESMHAVFDTLLRHNEKRALARSMLTLDTAAILEFFKEAGADPILLGTIADKMDPDLSKDWVHERAAYTFQVFAMARRNGQTFKLAPAPRTLMQKIFEFLKNILRYTSAHEQADTLMEKIFSGDLKTEVNVGAQGSLRRQGKWMLPEGVADFAAKSYMVLGHFARLGVAPMDIGARQTGIPAIIEIADKIYRSPLYASETAAGDTYLEQFNRQNIKWYGKFEEKYRTMSPQRREVLRRHVYSRKADSTITDPSLRADVRWYRSFLDDLYAHVTRRGGALGFRENYSPIIWDPQLVADNENLLRRMLKDKAAADTDAADIMIAMADSTEGTREALLEEGIENIIETLKTNGEAFSTNQGIDFDNPEPMSNRRGFGFMDDMDLTPFMYKDFEYVMQNYIKQTTRFAEFSHFFGKAGPAKSGVKAGWKIRDLLAKAREQGATEKEIEDTVSYVKAARGILGSNISPRMSKLFGFITMYQNIRVLAFATFASFVEIQGLAVRSGSVKVAWEGYKAAARDVARLYSNPKRRLQIRGRLKELSAKATLRPEEEAEFQDLSRERREMRSNERRFAEQMGTLDHAIMYDDLTMTHGFDGMANPTEKMNRQFFKWIGLEGWTALTRVAATNAGYAFIKENLRHPRKHSARFIKELNLNPEDVLFDSDGEIITSVEGLMATGMKREEAIRRAEALSSAIYRFVDQSVLRPNAATRPLGASDPHYMLLFHLKQFIFAIQTQIVNRVLKEAIVHKNFLPAAHLSSYVPLMLASDYLRASIQYALADDDDESLFDTMTWDEQLWRSTKRSGVTGMVEPVLGFGENISRYGGTGFETFVGPAGQQGFEGLRTMLTGTPSVWNALSNAMPVNNVYRNWQLPFSDD